MTLGKPRGKYIAATGRLEVAIAERLSFLDTWRKLLFVRF
jgi:hypothetical protein